MSKFKDMGDNEKPRERLINYGSDNLSNDELIAIILKTGSKDYNVKEVALKLIEIVGDIKKLKDVGIATLMMIPGIGRVKATELKAALELGKRVYSENLVSKQIFKKPIDVYNYFKEIYRYKNQEYFYCVYLDVKQKYIDKKCLFIGTIDKAIAHPREIFKEAYLLSASKIICVHNHPSGDVTPSRADIELTRKIQEIGLIHGILLIDHVIVGGDSYYSFHDNGLL